jgi:hypothetical protein
MLKLATIVRLLKRKRGVTAAEAAKALGSADASVRAAISRLEQQGAEITCRKQRGRDTVYTLVERFSGRKDHPAHQAQAASSPGKAASNRGGTRGIRTPRRVVPCARCEGVPDVDRCCALVLARSARKTTPSSALTPKLVSR